KENMSWFSKLFVGAGRPFHGEPFPRVIKTSAYEFHPISTPGHTSDHVCLLEPNKGWLFTGDLYVTPYPKVFLKDESISDYIESLEYLQSLDYDTVFCAHEGVIENGKEKMAKKLAYLKRIRSEVVQLHKLGYSDQGIRSKIFPKRVKLELISFGFFSRLHLSSSCCLNCVSSLLSLLSAYLLFQDRFIFKPRTFYIVRFKNKRIPDIIRTVFWLQISIT